ncbi:MAG: Mov34/MPN/PAD-1 family protein [Solirubrobacteraceae bacterium]
MRIAQSLLDAMVAHALADAPEECCGIVSSFNGEAVDLYPVENVAYSPLRYEMDSTQQMRVMLAIDAAGQEVGIIYHSHPRSEPYPSQTDIKLASYPDAVYVIVGLASAANPQVRAYTIRDQLVGEVDLTVV